MQCYVHHNEINDYRLCMINRLSPDRETTGILQRPQAQEFRPCSEGGQIEKKATAVSDTAQANLLATVRDVYVKHIKRHAGGIYEK